MLQTHATLDHPTTHDGAPFITFVPLRKPSDDLHPLVHISRIVDRVVANLGGPEPSCTTTWSPLDQRVMRAALLQALYSFGHDELLTEQLRYNALYRWFVGLKKGEEPWDRSVYVDAVQRLLASMRGAVALRDVLNHSQPCMKLMQDRFRINRELMKQWMAAARHQPDGKHASDDLSHSRFQRACQIIQRRITDGALTPESIAAEMCMSRRNLFLMFKKHGLTPTRVIRDMRLDRCRAMLADPSCHNRKILDLALDSGFAVPATFSRCFKERFGVTPHEVRSGALSDGVEVRVTTVSRYPEVAGCERRAVRPAVRFASSMLTDD